MERAPRTIDDLLAEARADLLRLTPAEALEAQRAGAVLVDIRPEANRVAEGLLPGAVVIERTVLEWRLDPRSDACLPEASYAARIIVLCQEGYTSSLAADALRSLGLDATDVVGGFKAWREARLPVACEAASA